MSTAIRRHNVTFVGGDFNLALFKVKDVLAIRGIDCTFLGSYAWRQNIIGGGGQPGWENARFDSLGLFAVKKVSTFARLITMPAIHGHGEGHQLHEFNAAHEYHCSSYLGGEKALTAAFSDTGTRTHGRGAAAAAAGDDEEEVLPHIKQKALLPEVWDAPKALCGRGAHMPLLFYVGDRSARSTGSLNAREQAMMGRGWGPSSANRTWHMNEVQGKGKGTKGQK